jgi:hypothetical protein
MSTVHAGANLSVIVGTPGKSTRFTVETSDWNYHGTVTYGSPVVVYLPPDLQISGSDYSNRQKAVHVYSQSRQKIFILAESFQIARSTHTAFLSYPYQPIEGLFLYEYSIMSSDDFTNDFWSEFLLVGCEENTIISIVPSQNISFPEDPQMSNSGISDAEEDRVSHQFILNRMQTLLIFSDDDLTGSLVVSNKPLTVISGHECISSLYPYYCYCSSCVPLVLQIHPKATWGTQFMTAIGQTSYTEIKGLTMPVQDFDVSITCGTGNATFEESIYRVNSNSYSQTFFRATHQYYYYYKELCYVESTEQAYVTSQVWLGDPAFIMLSPIDQYVHDIEFVTFPSSKFPSNFISITISEEHFDPNRILLDGVPVDCEWRAICNGTTDYCYLYTELIVGYACTTAISSDYLNPTQHNVAHADPEGLLSVISHGYGLTPSLSYAYLTGHVLKTSKHTNVQVSHKYNIIIIL